METPRRALVNIAILASLIATGCSAGSASAPISPAPTSTAPLSDGPRSPIAWVGPTPPPSAGPTLPASVDIASAGGKAVAGLPSVDWLVAGGGAIWATGDAGIEQIDPSGHRLRTIAIAGEPCGAMDFGFDAVWTTRCSVSGIARINPLDASVTLGAVDVQIPDSETSIAAGEGAVWLVGGTGSDTLVKIDPRTLKTIATFPVPPGSVAARAGLHGVWIVNPLAGTLERVDPATGMTVATIPVGRSARFLTVGEGGVWVMNQTDGTVVHVDPVANAVVATIAVGSPIDGGDIAAGGGAVWVRGTSSLVARIDPAVDRVTVVYGPPSGSGSVAVGEGAVWISAHDVPVTWRLPMP